MKFNIKYLTCLFFILIFGLNTKANENLNEPIKAKKIATEMIDRNDGNSIYRKVELLTCKYKTVSGKYKAISRPVKKIIENIMIVTGKNNKEEIGLGIIIQPIAERNMAFLQHDYDDGRDSDQWMYFPAMKKLKRIVSQSGNSPKDGSVFGSEISYEDVELMHVADYKYSYVGSETIDGKECEVVNMYTTGKRVRKSTYKRLKVWIDKKSKIEIKTEKYDRQERLSKTEYKKNIQYINNVWVPKIEITVNHKSKRMTMERVLKLAVNVKISKDLFKSRALLDTAFRENKMKIIRSKAR